MQGSKEHVTQVRGCKTKVGTATAISTPDKLAATTVFWQALWTKPHPTDAAGWDFEEQQDLIRDHLLHVPRGSFSLTRILTADDLFAVLRLCGTKCEVLMAGLPQTF